MGYKFLNFELLEQSRELKRSGEVVDVQPKVFDLIIFLIQNRNRAVSKEEIQDKIWANTAVTETALTRSIMKARKVLSSGEDSQVVIKTIHGHGYRFIAEIINDRDIDTKSSTIPVKKSWIPVIVLTILLSLIGLASVFISQDSYDENSTLAVMPFINDTNDEEYSWTPVGLMSLATQMIKSENIINTISYWTTSKATDWNFDVDMDIADDTIIELKSKLKASHLLFAKLTKDSGVFTLSYAVYHPRGKQKLVEISGSNPTELTQKMAKSIVALLPGAPISTQHRIVSEDTFTNELYSRGMAKQIEGDAGAARNYFHLVIQEDPSLFWPRYEYALTSRLMGNYGESEKELKKLLKIHPDLTKDPSVKIAILNALGNAYLRTGKKKLAIEHYQQGYKSSIEIKNYKYAALTANNVGLIHKRNGNYNQARTWISRSIEASQSGGSPVKTYTHYLLGQIELNLGNLDKAEIIFDHVIEVYQEKNQKRNLAAVTSTQARLYKFRGQYKKSWKFIERSRILQETMKNKLGIIDNRLNAIDLFIEEGRYQKALEWTKSTQSLINELNQTNRQSQIQNILLKIYFLQGDLKQAEAILQLIPDNNDNQASNDIKIKIAYLKGSESILENHLGEYTSEATASSNASRLSYLDLNIFLNEKNKQEEKLNQLYRQYATLSRGMGYNAKAAHALIKLFYLNLTNNKPAIADDIAKELAIYNLSWWEFDLLNAEIAFYSKDYESAKELAYSAKNSSTESWTTTNELQYQRLIK